MQLRKQSDIMGKIMNRSIISGLLLICSLSPIQADDIDWIITSDRTMNSDIIQQMTGGGTNTALRIAAALGKRKDPDASEIISFFYSSIQGKEAPRAELILTAIFRSLFSGDMGFQERRERFLANRDILIRVISDLRQFESTDLKNELFRMMIYPEAPRFSSLIGEEAGELIRQLRQTRGYLNPGETEEILVILDVIVRLSLVDLKGLCVQFAQYSSDKRVVTQARQAAGKLTR
jgi:hypothetical protein